MSTIITKIIILYSVMLAPYLLAVDNEEELPPPREDLKYISLHEAAATNNWGPFLFVFETWPDKFCTFLSVKDENGNTPLHIAAKNDNTGILSFINSRINLNPLFTIQNQDRATVLHIICSTLAANYKNNQDIVTFLNIWWDKNKKKISDLSNILKIQNKDNKCILHYLALLHKDRQYRKDMLV